MKRETIIWGILTAAVVLIPAIVRGLSGQPLLPGTEAYAIAGVLETIFPRTVATLSVILFSAGLMACAVILTHKSLRVPAITLNATLAMIVFSPVVFATLFAPSQALFALLLAATFHIKGYRKAGTLLLAILALTIGHISIQGSRPLVHAIVELGGLNAYGVFSIIAAVIGAYVLWENKARYYFLTLAIIALVGLSFAYPSLMFFGTVAVAAVGGIGLARLYRAKWTFPLVRTLTLILFFCGILFASISSLLLIISAPPSMALVSGLSELRYALPEGNVLTHPTYSPWMSYWSQRHTADISDTTLQSVWYSRNLDNTTHLLDTYLISSIIITPAMKTGLIWKEDEEGLLFLLAHSTKFKRIASGNTVEAWAYVPEES